MSRPDANEIEYPPGLQSLSYGNSDNLQSTIFLSRERSPSGTSLSQTEYAAYLPKHVSLSDRDYGFGLDLAPNRNNPNPFMPPLQNTQSLSTFNHNDQRSALPAALPSSQTQRNLAQQPSVLSERDVQLYRHVRNPTLSNTPLPPNSNAARSTLLWTNIEPWMDEEYVKQVCGLMGWDPVNIKVPHPAPDPVTGQQANNPGYCFLTFPTPAHAASVLAQMNNAQNLTMPNSSKPFVLNWATSATGVSPVSNSFPAGATTSAASAQQQPYPKEYSIFVGDLAPETSNSDLVAVFRNPVLGLRNDREPKFIRPFLSCKSAKIMLDPVTGVSRGYGFVRFTDEADQQRALIEMHGLYCLSRPMRISPATAKFKPPPPMTSFDLSQLQLPPSINGLDQPQPVTVALPLPNVNQTKSVSMPIAAASSSNSLSSTGGVVSSSGSGTSIGASSSANSLTSTNTSISSSSFASLTPDDMMNLPNHVLAQIAQQYASGELNPIRPTSGNPAGHDAPLRQSFGFGEGGAPHYTISEESWKHHAQARAILGNLIGPNGEQLTSTDPYNTTVFVGGLSPLISEETLRTFFAPFGDIHYVKVPVGKHCGFVQFVRKADAETAIEKMQGFPIGGSRIRLSWGRSQYKAAQAAAQAAQAAALQSQSASVLPAPNMMTQEQALQILQKLNLQGYFGNNILSSNGIGSGTSLYSNTVSNSIFSDQKVQSQTTPTPTSSYFFESLSEFGTRPDIQRSVSNFSPFSPDPNVFPLELKSQDSYSRSEPQLPSRGYTSGFFPLRTQDLMNVPTSSGNKTSSPISAHPPSTNQYNPSAFFDPSGSSIGLSRAPGRPEPPISRPSSGQTLSSLKGHRIEQDNRGFDQMVDLNTTFASLDLDSSWKPVLESSPNGNETEHARMTELQKRSSSPAP